MGALISNYWNAVLVLKHFGFVPLGHDFFFFLSSSGSIFSLPEIVFFSFTELLKSENVFLLLQSSSNLKNYWASTVARVMNTTPSGMNNPPPPGNENNTPPREEFLSKQIHSLEIISPVRCLEIKGY